VVDIEMSQSQQEYVKKSLLSEIEESLLKGHGIRNTVQVSVLLFPLSYDSSISRLVYRIWCSVLMTFFLCFLQSDFSNKASETSERDYAIPIQCLRKAIEVGVDPSYAIPKVRISCSIITF
jgi:hypothetical protein